MFQASFSGKAYYGSAEGCYFIINLLFVLFHPSALLTQIMDNMGKGREERVVQPEKQLVREPPTERVGLGSGGHFPHFKKVQSPLFFFLPLSVPGVRPLASRLLGPPWKDS